MSQCTSKVIENNLNNYRKDKFRMEDKYETIYVLY